MLVALEEMDVSFCGDWFCDELLVEALPLLPLKRSAARRHRPRDASPESTPDAAAPPPPPRAVSAGGASALVLAAGGGGRGASDSAAAGEGPVAHRSGAEAAWTGAVAAAGASPAAAAQEETKLVWSPRLRLLVARGSAATKTGAMRGAAWRQAAFPEAPGELRIEVD